MKKEMVMTFTVDKPNNRIRVERSFAAPLARVWAAWTDPAILDRWWAPKPYRTETRSMDFRAGGTWLYAMIGPDGTAHWCRADYEAVSPLESYTGLDAFCDERGTVNTGFPRSRWTVSFRGDGDMTFVTIEVAYSSLADLEKIIEMGFREGFTAALENLDGLFAG